MTNELPEKLIKLLRVDETLYQLADMYRQRSKTSISERSPDADPAILAETLEVFDEEFDKEIPSLIGILKGLYPENYTSDEMSKLILFFESSLGKKFLEGGKNIERQLSIEAPTWSSKASKLAFGRTINKMESI